MTVLPDGNVGLAGTYHDDISFGSTNLPHDGASAGFLVRLTANDGEPTFAGHMSSGASVIPVSVVATSNAVVVGGRFDAQANIFGKTATPAGGFSDGFAAAVILP